MSQIDFTGRNSWELEADFIRNCCAIVQDGCCSLILVCHTVKGSGGTGMERSSGDVQGSAMLTRLAQTTLIFDTCELEDKEIKLSGGLTFEAPANRILMIAAARNGPGTRSKIAFMQDPNGPIFHEIGYLATPKKQRKN
jgi:RecA-family ATPase